MIIRVAYASLYLHSMRISGIPAQEPWSAHFDQLALKLGIRRDVRLLISEKITVPGLIGWIKPVVIVPAGMLTQLPLNQLETILMHELYHLKRYDFLVNAMQLLLEGIFFYNPAVWLISSSIRVEREHCCDDRVVGSCQTPLLYARALFELSNKDHTFGNLMTAAGGTDASGLSNRIIRILKQKAMKTDIREKILSLTVFVAGVSIFLIINGFSAGVSGIQPTGIEPGLTIDRVVYPDFVEANPIPEATMTEMAPDTVPVPSEIENENVGGEELSEEEIDRIIDEAKDAAQEAMEEIDWEEIRESMEEARNEAMEEIDWEEIRESMKEARKEAMEEINWEEIRQEIEESMNEMEEIDWDAMKQEIEDSMNDLKQIDWEQMRLDIDQSMKEIDWEQMRKDIEESMKNIDIESFRIDIENSLDDIDWGGIKMDLEQFRIELDSLKQDFVLNPDPS
jgi:hypothetical protein